MADKEKCLCEPAGVLIFSCAGGSNVGQIANQAAVELAKIRRGRLFCLAGIGGHVSGIIESAKAAETIIAIDGCPVQCARKTLEHAGFKVDTHLVVTELGIEKSYDLDIGEEQPGIVVERLKEGTRA